MRVLGVTGEPQSMYSSAPEITMAISDGLSDSWILASCFFSTWAKSFNRSLKVFIRSLSSGGYFDCILSVFEIRQPLGHKKTLRMAKGFLRLVS